MCGATGSAGTPARVVKGDVSRDAPSNVERQSATQPGTAVLAGVGTRAPSFTPQFHLKCLVLSFPVTDAITKKILEMSVTKTIRVL